MIRIVSLLVCIMLLCSATCFAGEYVDQMNEKIVRGVKNLISSPAEIGKAMSTEMEDGIPVYNALVGIIKGSGHAVSRALSAVYDFVVAPFPNAKTYTPEPETLF